MAHKLFLHSLCNLLITYVLYSQSCFKYYSSDDISKDGDGMDEQCRYDSCILYFNENIRSL